MNKLPKLTLAVLIAGISAVVPALNTQAASSDAATVPPLVEAVRTATAQYRDIEMAQASGYGLLLGCVSDHGKGAMGVHYLNPSLVGDGIVEVDKPEILIYEAMPSGRMKLLGVEYITFVEAWQNGDEAAAPPVMMGQLFHYAGAPNRYNAPANYALHVWAWKHNPYGAFASWNPNVKCDYFVPEAS